MFHRNLDSRNGLSGLSRCLNDYASKYCQRERCLLILAARTVWLPACRAHLDVPLPTASVRIRIRHHAIELSNLSFSYRRRRVLDGLNWAVGSGVTAMLGPNGSKELLLQSNNDNRIKTNKTKTRIIDLYLGFRRSRKRGVWGHEVFNGEQDVLAKAQYR